MRLHVSAQVIGAKCDACMSLSAAAVAAAAAADW